MKNNELIKLLEKDYQENKETFDNLFADKPKKSKKEKSASNCLQIFKQI